MSSVPPTSAPSSPHITLTLHADKQCKGSVRYATNDPKSLVQSIYVSREWLPRMPDSVMLTLEAKS